MIVWVTGALGQYDRVTVLGSLGEALGIEVQSLDTGKIHEVRLWDIRAIEFDGDLIVEFTPGNKVNPADFVKGPL